jgi:hypothetical protein
VYVSYSHGILILNVRRTDTVWCGAVPTVYSTVKTNLPVVRVPVVPVRRTTTPTIHCVRIYIYSILGTGVYHLEALSTVIFSAMFVS